MTLRNPAVYEEALTYHARDDRQLVKAQARGSGVLKAGDFAVSQNGTPNMSVNIAAGEALDNGSEATDQGAYYLFNDAVVNVAIAAADPTNPRNDLVILTVRDDFYSTHGGSPATANTAAIQVITGTPNASPVDPATPANSVLLARVRVDALVTTIVNAKITDLRPYVGISLAGPVSVQSPALLGASVAVVGRYIGSWNTTGSPAGGPYLVGDFGIDSAGALWICSVAGSPGTWRPPAALGTLGTPAQVTASQSGVTTEVDITGLTVTVTTLAGRRYKVTVACHVYSTVAADYCSVTIKQDGTAIAGANRGLVSANSADRIYESAIVTPSAASHTFKATLQRISGTGSLTMYATATQPAFILVEDIGT